VPCRLTNTTVCSFADIYLGQNNLTGTFPSVVGTRRPNNWRMFSLYQNKMTGLLPSGMNLKNAYMLDFSNNKFYGKLPNDISQVNYSKLRLLYLNNNAFAGTIPESLMQLRKLKGLFLNDNREFNLWMSLTSTALQNRTDASPFISQHFQCLQEEFQTM
jgi:hypothetical protein